MHVPGKERTGELDESDAIVLVHLMYFFLLYCGGRSGY